jgi:hypothetical protein
MNRIAKLAIGAAMAAGVVAATVPADAGVSVGIGIGIPGPGVGVGFGWGHPHWCYYHPGACGGYRGYGPLVEGGYVRGYGWWHAGRWWGHRWGWHGGWAYR